MGCGNEREEAPPFEPFEEPPIQAKVIVIGPKAVGKTTMIQSLLDKDASNVGAATTKKQSNTKQYDVNVNGEPKKLDLNVWDTPGLEHTETVKVDDFRDVDAVVLVYSIDLDSSFDAACALYDKAKEISGKNAVYFLVANKCDLDAEGRR